MNTGKVLLYDDYCPLCSWYSGLFVKFGLLNAGNRIPFSKADIEMPRSMYEKGETRFHSLIGKREQLCMGSILCWKYLVKKLFLSNPLEISDR